jgi:ribonuclease-3
MKARFVSEPALAHAAALLGVGPLIDMAASEAASRGRDRPSVLSDAFEAVLAVIYLVNGLEPARRFVRDRLIAEIDLSEAWDHKSLLQELMQEKRRATPIYRIQGSVGPPHDRKFIAEVVIKDQVFGRGTGRSKKVAEQAAAAAALASVDRLGRRKPQRKAKA